MRLVPLSATYLAQRQIIEYVVQGCHAVTPRVRYPFVAAIAALELLDVLQHNTPFHLMAHTSRRRLEVHSGEHARKRRTGSVYPDFVPIGLTRDAPWRVANCAQEVPTKVL